MSKSHRRSLVETHGLDAKEREQRLQFIQLSPDDAALLSNLAAFIQKHADQLAEQHYAHVAHFEEPYAMLTGRQEMSKLLKGQAEYFVDLFQGDYDEAYFERRLRTGRAYAGMGMAPKWYIGAYAVYAGLLFPLLARHYFLRPRKLVRALLALTRVLFLDQQLAVEMYLDRVMSELHEVAGQVAASAAQVALASEQLNAATEQASHATQQIAATIQQVALGTAQQSESAAKTTAAVAQMARAIDGVAQGAQEQAAAVTRSSDITAQISAAIQQVAANAQAGATGAADAAQATRDGARTVQGTIRGMESIKAKVGLSAQKVQEMGRRSEQIGAIVERIDDIASQTNLLALNAAIEAARAGEHGKGFAVVADEVRKLAENSAAATREIAELIKGIQQTVAEAVQAMDEGAAEVEAGTARAGEAGQALDSILQAVEVAHHQVGEIAAAAQQVEASSGELVGAMDAVSAVVEENTAATEEMAAGSTEVTQAIENIASVSEENNAAVEEVSAAAEEMNAQVETVSASAESLSEMARTLQELVAQFDLDDGGREVQSPIVSHGGNGRRREPVGSGQ